jgi:Fur family transcriptional regulator, ferric uptake regulator
MKKNDTYTDLLHSVGLRATNDRKRILMILDKRGKPMSVADICQKARHSHIATVYRTLETYVRKGIVRRVNISDTCAFYEIATAPHHHHIVCEECGFVEKIDECFLDSALAHQLTVSKKFAQITGHTFEVFGVCKKCAKL